MIVSFIYGFDCLFLCFFHAIVKFEFVICFFWKEHFSFFLSKTNTYNVLLSFEYKKAEETVQSSSSWTEWTLHSVFGSFLDCRYNAWRVKKKTNDCLLIWLDCYLCTLSIRAILGLQCPLINFFSLCIRIPGKLHICSRSLVFDPANISLPLIKMNFSQNIALKLIKSVTS